MRKAGVSTSSASLPTTITKSTVAGSLRTIGLNTTGNIVRGSNTATDPEFNNRTAISYPIVSEQPALVHLVATGRDTLRVRG
jgi:hypothetical protein